METEISIRDARIPVTVLRVRGDVGAESSHVLLRTARETYEGGARHLLLDFSQVGYMSSAGLKAIHQIYLLLRSDLPEEDDTQRKGILSGTYSSPHLKLLEPNKYVKKALSLAGFDMFLDIHTDMDKAVASF